MEFVKIGMFLNVSGDNSESVEKSEKVDRLSECIGNDILLYYVDSFFNLVHLFTARFLETEVDTKRRTRCSCRNTPRVLKLSSTATVRNCGGS